MLSFLRGAYAPILGIDAGSDQVRIHQGGRGLVLVEPSVLALRQAVPGGFPEVVGAGERAHALLFKAPRTISAERPIRDGMVAEPDLAALLFQAFFQKVLGRPRLLRARPRVVAGIPAGATRLEKAAFFQALYAAGASRVFLVERMRAASVALSLGGPKAILLLDIGRDTAEAAVLSMGSVVHVRTLRGGAALLDRGLIAYVRSTYNLLIGESSAETVKKGFLSAVKRDEARFELRGRDLISNLPRSVELGNLELLEAVRRPLENWVGLVTEVLADLSPEVACDLMETGMCLLGGGALLDGLTEFMAEQTRLPVRVAEDPEAVVIRGLGTMVERLPEYEQVLEKG